MLKISSKFFEYLPNKYEQIIPSINVTGLNGFEKALGYEEIENKGKF